jgi:hypothetical protein
VFYRQRDAQELMKGNRFELLPWAERLLASRRPQ